MWRKCGRVPSSPSNTPAHLLSNFTSIFIITHYNITPHSYNSTISINYLSLLYFSRLHLQLFTSIIFIHLLS